MFWTLQLNCISRNTFIIFLGYWTEPALLNCAANELTCALAFWHQLFVGWSGVFASSLPILSRFRVKLLSSDLEAPIRSFNWLARSNNERTNEGTREQINKPEGLKHELLLLVSLLGNILLTNAKLCRPAFTARKFVSRRRPARRAHYATRYHTYSLNNKWKRPFNSFMTGEREFISWFNVRLQFAVLTANCLKNIIAN